MSETEDPGRDQDVWPIDRALSRRRVLRAAGAFGLAATSLPALLAACGDSDDASSSAASTSAGASSEAAPATSEASSAPATSEAATDTGAATSAPATTAPEPTSSAAVAADIKRAGGSASATSAAARASRSTRAAARRSSTRRAHYNLYDPLTRVNPDFSQSPGLALEWNARTTTSTVWEVKLRPDVVLHDGKSFTADDVIYTLRQMGDEKHISPRRA